MKPRVLTCRHVIEEPMMKKIFGGILIAFLLVLIYFSFRSNPTDQIIDPPQTPSSNGDYLDQTPPGKQFVQFASGVVPPDMYHSVTVSPDGQEIYWAARTGIMMTTKRDGHWTTPEVASFSGKLTDEGYSYDDAPVVSPDNERLYFNSLRAYGSSPALSRWSFWYCERTPTGWSEPQPLPDIINLTGGIHWQVSVSNSGTIYFGALLDSTPVRAAIYRSRLVNGVYTAPEPLNVVNNVGSVLAPFIAPDESYIIFNKEEGGGMTIGTYICFKGSYGEWLSPQKMVQFPSMRESSFVTRDGKYIFCKNYWASAQIIEYYRPKN
jgi:hypothetical protein